MFLSGVVRRSEERRRQRRRWAFFSNLLIKTLGAVCLAVVVIVSGCASDQPKYRYLAAVESDYPGYAKKESTAVFENQIMRLKARPLLAGEFKDQSPILNDLAAKEFIIIRLEIENLSPQSSLIFNPSYIALMTDSMDYFKPIDYTDMYDIVKEKDETGSSLRGLKGRFYDLTVTLMPGKSVGKLLIFKPLTEDADAAQLIIKNIYIGKEDVDLALPFVVKARPKEKKR
ncbi:MAG: hypothetical protein HY886_09055 [Deltaproteobacteria bacterium]|nr:hypothetical protein [Deltaproteobacteria bacterium]